mmetsp:Transcript_21334/g.51760  ORF Transcript_21334/g.51760 Transcript_21334/m.51760 type:complete len:294 (-) Transcript_21334:506-1387(-)|eukprot:CAMPEP_0114108846 /NCGR_PEP_ID=MMETSP0043_2-20121206/445_1 /TAXON_ID=464988 /ORGANISM="Hemiselmis andersenii, Strain CCMP644" /LENGTH=293 /DNA_ID=CAMNT_0001200653 /DNA_START=76 /DNA_END=957 /DNA_ORIENTATION=-
MGCAASSHANTIVPMPSNMPPAAQQPGVKAPEPAVVGVKAVETPKDEVVPQNDDERSANTTPYAAETAAEGLGATEPLPGTKSNDSLRADSPPSPPVNEPAILPPPQALDANAEQDIIKVPEDPSLLVPYWEKQPLPARPGTSSRRQQKEGKENKLVVYKTEKTKKLEAQARKKREGGEGESPEKVTAKKKSSKKAGSSLPPIKQRMKMHASSSDIFTECEVLTPGKKDKDSNNKGDDWTVQVPPAPKKELSAIAEAPSREGSGSSKTKGPADVMTLEVSPIRAAPESLAFSP